MKKQKKSSPVSQFLVSLFLGANLVTLSLLWVCCAITWLNPSLHPRVVPLGLLFPVFLVLNLVFVPLWLLFKPRLMVVPVVGMALCGGYILDYCPLHWGNGEPGDMKVITWNSHNMVFYPGDSLALATDYLLESDADIIVMQEFAHQRDKYKDFKGDMEKRGYQLEFQASQALLTRYPILSAQSVEMESKSTNAALVADLLRDGDTLTVFCVHLESYSLSADEKDDYGNVLRAPERGKVETEVSYLSGKIGVATDYRARQIRRLMVCLDSLPEGRSVLVCGDFNDTPISYAYQTMARRLDNAYRAGGRGVGITFNEKNFPFRIDHVFYSRDWVCTHAHIERSMTASDHYPLVTTLKRR